MKIIGSLLIGLLMAGCCWLPRSEPVILEPPTQQQQRILHLQEEVLRQLLEELERLKELYQDQGLTR